jgi:hypothetical protein
MADKLRPSGSFSFAGSLSGRKGGDQEIAEMEEEKESLSPSVYADSESLESLEEGDDSLDGSNSIDGSVSLDGSLDPLSAQRPMTGQVPLATSPDS